MFSFISQYAVAARAILIGLVLVAAIAFYHYFKNKHQNIGYQKAVAEYNEKLLLAERAARSKEQELVKKVGDAENEAKKRETKIIKLSADINNVNKRLRDTIENNSVSISESSRASVDNYARIVGIVFAECANEYRKMGENAERERSDKIMLLEAWPK